MSEEAILAQFKFQPHLDVSAPFPDAGAEPRYSPLLLAIGRKYSSVITEILSKQSKDEFINSFKGYEKYIGDPGAFILKLDDLELEHKTKFPAFVKEFILDLQDRKFLVLLLGAVGKSTFHGIEWEMQGHFNFLQVAKQLFKSQEVNHGKIIEKIKLLAAEDLGDHQAAILCSSTKGVIELLAESPIREPQEIADDMNDIFPVLVGTRNPPALHAEGFVKYRNIYLFVERSNPREPGVNVYNTTKEFDKKAFQEFLVLALKSAEGGLENALSFEYYAGNTTASRGFVKIHYIPMDKQEDYNCTIASPEGMLVASLFCALLKHSVDEQLALSLAKTYGELALQHHKMIEVKKFLLKEINKDLSSETTAAVELKSFLTIIKDVLEKHHLLDPEIHQLLKRAADEKTSQAAYEPLSLVSGSQPLLFSSSIPNAYGHPKLTILEGGRYAEAVAKLVPSQERKMIQLQAKSLFSNTGLGIQERLVLQKHLESSRYVSENVAHYLLVGQILLGLKALKIKMNEPADFEKDLLYCFALQPARLLSLDSTLKGMQQGQPNMRQNIKKLNELLNFKQPLPLSASGSKPRSPLQ